MLLPILRWPDSRLSQPCAPAVLDDDLRRLAADMLETMYAAPGRGLAAPQVGRLVRMFVMDVAWRTGEPDPVAFVNPSIEPLGGPVTGPEGCLAGRHGARGRFRRFRRDLHPARIRPSGRRIDA